MNILISISHLNIGGAQTFAARLAKGLSNNHAVFLYDYEYVPSNQLNSVLNILPEEVRVLKLPRFLDRLGKKLDYYVQKLNLNVNIWLFLKRTHFRALLKIHRIALINTHLYHSDRFVTGSLQHSKLPIVLSDHGDYRFVIQENTATVEDVEQIFNRVNQVVYVSNSNAEVLSKFLEKFGYGTKIYYGIPKPASSQWDQNARKKLGIQPTDFVFGMVARGIPEKGWAEAIEAFKRVHDRAQRTVHLILVGASDYLTSLREPFDQELKPHIHFVGHTSDPNFWIEAFDVGLLPTYFPGESLPNSVIEYLSFGKPVIATKIGGILEMLAFEDRQAGSTVDLTPTGVANSFQIAEAMLRYLDKPDLLEEHAQLAKQSFEKFSIDKCIAHYEAVFADLISTTS